LCKDINIAKFDDFLAKKFDLGENNHHKSNQFTISTNRLVTKKGDITNLNL
jgi:hypothetical protein